MPLTNLLGRLRPRGERGPRSDPRAHPRARRPRARRRLILALGLIVLTAAGIGAWLFTRDDSAGAAAASTATVGTQTVRETVTASGTVAAAATADLDFEVAGTVTRVWVEAGDRVRKGERLARVDDATLTAQREAAESSLAAARAQLTEDTDAGASEVQLTADEAAVLSAEAELDSARNAVRDAVLTASMSGTVSAVGVAVGDSVGGSSGSSSTTSGSTGSSTGSGTTGGGSAGSSSAGSSSTSSSSTSSTTGSDSAAVSLVSRNRFVVQATVASADVASVTEGLQVEVTVTGVDETVYGTVAEVGAVAETSSSGAAVFPVTIEVTGTRDDLYAGASAEATVIVRQRDGVLTVTTRAVQSDDEGTYVDVLVDGVAQRRGIEVGQTYGMATEVVSGLEEGDVVEVAGFAAPGGAGGQQGEQGEMPGGGQLPDMGGGLPGGTPPAGFGGGR